MRKYIEKEIIEKHNEYIEKSVTCNKCGKLKVLEGEDYTREWQANEFQSMHCSFGYGSGYDQERWQFDLCEDCLTDIVREFKIVPDGFGQDQYIAYHPQTMFEKWKETGVIDLEAGMTKEEIEENGGSIYSDEEVDMESEQLEHIVSCSCGKEWNSIEGAIAEGYIEGIDEMGIVITTTCKHCEKD